MTCELITALSDYNNRTGREYTLLVFADGSGNLMLCEDVAGTFNTLEECLELLKLKS